MCIASLLLPALLCGVLDWCLLVWQIVKEVMTLDRHDGFHWMEVLEVPLLDWQGNNLIHAFGLFGICTLCGSSSHTEATEKDNLKWTLPSLLNWRVRKSCTVGPPVFLPSLTAKQVQSVHFQELLVFGLILAVWSSGLSLFRPSKWRYGRCANTSLHRSPSDSSQRPSFNLKLKRINVRAVLLCQTSCWLGFLDTVTQLGSPLSKRTSLH